MAEDYYRTLCIRRGASVDQIRAAYRKLALACHPDLHPRDRQAAEKFRQLQAAFEVLDDPPRRRIYDESLSRSATAPSSQPDRSGWGDRGVRSPFRYGASFGEPQHRAQPGRGDTPHLRFALVTVVLLPAALGLLLLGGYVVSATGPLLAPLHRAVAVRSDLVSVLWILMTLICFAVMLWPRS